MIIPMTAANLEKWLSFGPCRVRQISGFNNQASDLYIQLHELSQAQAVVTAGKVIPDGSVPKMKSLLAQQSNGFKYEWVDGLDFSELTIAVSSTETSLTVVGASGALDMSIVIDGPYLVPNYTGLTVVGDLITAISTQQAWAEAAGPFILHRIDVVNQDGSDPLFFYGVAQDSFPGGAKVQFSQKIAASATYHLNFGQGVALFEKTASDQALHQGLSLTASLVYGGSAQPNGMACRTIYSATGMNT